MAPTPAAQNRSEDEAMEMQPLIPNQQALPSAAVDRSASQPGSPSKAGVQSKQPSVGLLTSQSSGITRVKSQELGQCRICLEEDALSNLETPCGCTGTQRHAHKECIQKWVNEKHHTTCEICDQPYQGSYLVPPPPPPTAGEPLTLVNPMGLYLTVDDERVAGQLLHDVYDEWDDHRQPTVSWCFSFVMLLMFMMILQSTMTVPSDGSGASGGSSPSPSPPADPSAAAAAGSAAVGLLAGFSLVVMWLVSKLFLVVLPLVMLMRLATRAQEQAAEAAAAAAVGTVPGLDAPSQSGRAPAEDRDHALVTLITRLAAARAAAQARQMQQAASAAAAGTSSAAAGSGAGSDSSSSSSAGGEGSADVELQASQQVRRHALSRLGRDPTFWAPAGGSSAGSRAGDVEQQPAEQEQEQQAEVAASQRLASLRALMRAITATALHREAPGQQQQAGAGGSSNAAAGSSATGGDSRHSMV